MPSPSPSPEGGDVPGSPTLKVAVVARRLGVAPATLRTWARRYGLGPSAHVAGAHRQYSSADLARLVVMRRLTLEGVAPVEAARIAVGTPVDDMDLPPEDEEIATVTPMPSSEHTTRLDAAALRDIDLLVGDAVDGLLDYGRAGGGRVVAMPRSGPAARGLARAAIALDASGCRRILSTSIARDGVVATWETLARPVLAALGNRWEATGVGIDVEHLFTDSVLGALRSSGDDRRRPSSGTALLACAEDDQHSLPLHVLGAALEERGVAVRVLGARVPRAALVDAVRRSGPAAVVVYATLPVVDPDALAELPRMRPPPRLFVGGPGWAGIPLPEGTRAVLSLEDAVDHVAAVILP